MSIAALGLGIVSVVLAAMMTAPFFFWMPIFGIPTAVAGIGLSVTALIMVFRDRRAGREIEEGSTGHAVWGLVLSIAALAWQSALAMLWVHMTM